MMSDKFVSVPHPKQTVTASSKFVDPQNIAQHDVHSHKHASRAKRGAEAAEATMTNTMTNEPENMGPPVISATESPMKEVNGKDSDNMGDLIGCCEQHPFHFFIIS